jgi:hypothetical protein
VQIAGTNRSKSVMFGSFARVGIAALIISPAAALLGSLGTLVLANRHSRSMAAQARAWETRREAREVGVSLMLAASMLNYKLGMLVSMVSSIHNHGADKDKLLEALADEVEELQTDSANLTESLIRFRLSFADRSLLERASRIGELSDQLGLQLAQYLASLTGEGELQEATASVLASAREVGEAIAHFDKEAAARLAEPLDA